MRILNLKTHRGKPYILLFCYKNKRSVLHSYRINNVMCFILKWSFRENYIRRYFYVLDNYVAISILYSNIIYNISQI